MPLTFKYGNVYITIIRIILGAINAIYIYRKNTKMKKIKATKIVEIKQIIGFG